MINYSLYNLLVFCVVHRGDVISSERLMYYVLLTLKSSFGQAWELVCDVTQTATSNQTKVSVWVLKYRSAICVHKKVIRSLSPYQVIRQEIVSSLTDPCCVIVLFS